MRSFALALRAHRDYFADAALQAAADLDLPRLFAAPRDPREVAAAHGYDDARLLRLGRALADLGQLELTGDGRWRWLGDRAPLLPVIRQGWGLLSQVIRTGQPLDASAHLHAYQKAMASDHAETAAAWANAWAAQLPSHGELLDVGAGLGTWGRALVHAAEDWRAVLVDRPEVLALAQPQPRIELAPGDATRLPQDRPFDLAVCAHLLHHLSDQQCVQTLTAMSEALGPGGWLSIVEVFALPGQPAPDPALWFDLDMALYSPGGRVRSVDEIQRIAMELPLEWLDLRILDGDAGVAELRARRRG
jgi:SAM-dependent methyltransferase